MKQSISVGRPADLEPVWTRWLARHEARCHALSRREVRELGDCVLLHDPADREPFWNRIAGMSWPSAPGAFDRRLAEAIALFASLDRIPHIWPLPGFDEPPDLAERLKANGFDDLGAGIMMGLDPDAAVLDVVADRDITIERIDGANARAADEDTQTIRGVAVVLAEAFTIERMEADAIETDTWAAMNNPSFHAILVCVDGEPAATVRRTTFGGASYLSSIGTRPEFRGRGLGALVTSLAARDSMAASRFTYLGVFSENEVARRLYARLGFVPIGGPAPDLLLMR